MKIAIGCDHGGFTLKQLVIDYLKGKDYQIIDEGTYNLDSVDYPEYGIKVAEDVANKLVDKGIVICSTGIGISIAANKVKGIRCALVHDTVSAALTRQHNDSNVIAFGAKIIDFDKAKEILDIWLNTEYEGGRHDRRINKISAYEEK